MLEKIRLHVIKLFHPLQRSRDDSRTRHPFSFTCCTGWGGHLFRRFCKLFSESSTGCRAILQLPKQVRGTYRTHITKPSEQVAAPPSKFPNEAMARFHTHHNVASRGCRASSPNFTHVACSLWKVGTVRADGNWATCHCSEYGKAFKDIGIPDIWSISSAIPVIWSIGYMVIPDTWSILAGPDADQVSGTHCISIYEFYGSPNIIFSYSVEISAGNSNLTWVPFYSSVCSAIFTYSKFI